MFADETPERKGQIVARAWQAIGIPAEHCTDELMAEWIDGLQSLELDQIAIGVKECQRRKRTAPIDEFVAFCTPTVERVKPSLPVDFNETKRQSWEKLGLSKTRGPLPEGVK